MRIAIFSDSYLPQVHGVATVVHQSALVLAEMGHEVCVFTISKHPIDLIDNIVEDKFKVVILPSLPAGVYPGERFTLPLGMTIGRLRDFNPDLIHVHTPFSMGLEAVIGKLLLEVPLVGTHHTFYDHYLKHVGLDYAWFKKPSWKYIIHYYNRCDLVLSPSKALAEEMSLHGLKTPVEVMPNFIDANFYKPCSSLKEKKKLKDDFLINGKSIVYMGRVSYEKNIDQVLLAFKEVTKKDDDVKLMIVGDGPDKKKLENLADALGIKDRIIFTGFLHGRGLVEALWANDIFVTASKSENMPVSVIEAMATGLPVVAVAEKGLKEIVHQDKNGFLVEADNPGQMAKQLLKILGDDDLLKNLSHGSREVALEYSKEKVSKKLEAAYKKVIKQKK